MTKMFNKSYSYSSISDKGCRSRGCCAGACCNGGCGKCMASLPYATLIATILCCAGVGVFLGSFYRAVALTLRMFEDVFKFRFYWLSDLHIIFIGIGATMAVLSIILLLVGFLATGATRQKVYRGWKCRVGGRITCGIFMVITYTLEIVWIAVTICLVVITFVFMMFWGMCDNLKKGQCIDLRQFKFLTTPGTKIEDLELCGEGKLKNFCKDCVEESGILFLLALVASIVVVISLVNYLMCLAANYARIKDHQKFQDLQELQYLQETEMETLPKDRF